MLLWAVTLWTLDGGATVFGKSGVCYPDEAKVLFYWVCDAASPLAILAGIANVALTATVWAPVYIAAATVEPDAVAIALPIVAVHVIGLPLAIFVLVRVMAAALDLRRRIQAGRDRRRSPRSRRPRSSGRRPRDRSGRSSREANSGCAAGRQLAGDERRTVEDRWSCDLSRLIAVARPCGRCSP